MHNSTGLMTMVFSTVTLTADNHQRDGARCTDKTPPGQKVTGQKATTLDFHWRNLKSPDYVFTYATAE